MNWWITVGGLAILVFLSGCTIVNGTPIVTGGKRETTSPNEIRIYREAPAEYEELAMCATKEGDSDELES